DCRLKNIFPGQMSKTSVQRLPARHCPGHSNGINPELRHRRHVLGFQVLNRQSLRGPATRVQSVKLAGFRVPINGEQIATYAVLHWLNETDSSVSCDCGVYCRTAFAQNFCSRL